GAAEAAVFGVEAVGDQAELGYRIDIRDDGSAHIPAFAHIAAVDQKRIRAFPLPVDGDVAGTERTRYRAVRYRARCRRRHAWLQAQQVNIAAAVQRESENLLFLDHLPDLAVGRLHLHGCRIHFDRLCHIAHLHLDINAVLLVYSKVDSGLQEFLEAGKRRLHFVLTNRQSQDAILPHRIRSRCLTQVGFQVSSYHNHALEHGGARIRRRAENGTGYVRLQPRHEHQSQHAVEKQEINRCKTIIHGVTSSAVLQTVTYAPEDVNQISSLVDEIQDPLSPFRCWAGATRSAAGSGRRRIETLP